MKQTLYRIAFVLASRAAVRSPNHGHQVQRNRQRRRQHTALQGLGRPRHQTPRCAVPTAEVSALSERPRKPTP